MADRDARERERNEPGRPGQGEAGRGVRGSSGYGWGFEEQGFGDWGSGWQTDRRRGPDASQGDTWGGQGYGVHRGGGFVDHAWEPGGRYDEESGLRDAQRRRQSERQGVGGYGQGGGGDEAGYGGYAAEGFGGGPTTGLFGYGEGDRGGTFEGANPGYGGYGTGGGGYTASAGGGTSGIGGRQGQIAEHGPYVGHGPQGWRRTDESLHEQVCEILTRHGRIDASHIRVTVDNSEITLEGTVGSRREKRLAEEVLEGCHGLRDIHNHLKIRSNDE